jgi:hypothetical protein
VIRKAGGNNKPALDGEFHPITPDESLSALSTPTNSFNLPFFLPDEAAQVQANIQMEADQDEFDASITQPVDSSLPWIDTASAVGQTMRALPSH